MIQAVIFDLDGVLIDSEPVWEQVRRQVVAEHGGQWADDAQQRLMGMSTGEWAAYLAGSPGADGPGDGPGGGPGGGPGDGPGGGPGGGLGVKLPPDQVADLVIRQMADRYREHLPLLPGAVEAVRALAARWPLGLASSAPAVLIETVLDQAGLAASFAATMSTEQVPRGKPAPDIYLAVSGALGIDPRHGAAIEDSANGLRSAAAAGLAVVAVPHPRYPPGSQALSLAAVVLPSLKGLTPEVIAGLG